MMNNIKIGYSRSNSPCNGCTKRLHPTKENPKDCHNAEVCPEWAEYERKRNKETAEIKKRIKGESEADSYHIGEKSKALTRRRGKR